MEPQIACATVPVPLTFRQMLPMNGLYIDSGGCITELRSWLEST
jgi:hypothetical protein